MTDMLRIATRESPLALWQAHHVADRLRALYPGLGVELVPMTTRGDQILDQPLAAIGGKGLFLKELEVALLEGRADLAVHSLKDVPMQLEPGFQLAGVMAREDPSDALVSGRFESLQALPEGARVGTSSLRRQVQLRALRPDLELLDLRGNVNTRLARLDRGEYDAIVLASAGLIRLGFAARIRQRLAPPEYLLPAAGQGVLGLEIREGDARTAELLAPLVDPAATRATTAERVMTGALGGSCRVPIAAYAEAEGEELVLHGLVGDRAGRRCLRVSLRGPAEDAAVLGTRVAAALIDRGALALLAE
ncbi:MAG: hydroxymethylbilane synthase [Xanthomonadales bacterium]|nr:hydroxymethylbilane synthase [Xanthomonadales bacterium]